MVLRFAIEVCSDAQLLSTESLALTLHGTWGPLLPGMHVCLVISAFTLQTLLPALLQKVQRTSILILSCCIVQRHHEFRLLYETGC